MNKILLIIDYSSEFDRKLLRGLVRYSNEKGPWLFYRLPAYYTSVHGENSIVKWAKKWKADAIIGQLDNISEKSLSSLKIPVVMQNYHNLSSTFSNLTGDYYETGKMAADFFKKRMFQNFAFFGIKGILWSDERCLGFKTELEKQNFSVNCFESAESEEKILKDVTLWLKSLPKPTALFCCDDSHALFISELCRINNIHIPQEISLLGVDNDDLMCNISDPPISSIDLAVENGGYALGKLIDEQIKRKSNKSCSIVINPVRIQLRRSTELFNIKDIYISKAVSFIEANYNDINLNVASLLKKIPMSRRNFEIKFKKETNYSVYQYIINCRINHLSDLLISTDHSLSDMSIEVGFKDCNNISRIFKKIKGCSPLEYRKKSQHK